MSKKQEIYANLLRLSLPTVRNSLSHQIIYGNKRKRAYYLCQLVHDLYSSILEESFVEHDFGFLNIHARNYCERAVDTPEYESIKSLLQELFNIVPDNMRCKLEWKGP